MTSDMQDFGYLPAHKKIYNSFLDLIGGTPLVAIPWMQQKDCFPCRILLKLEFFNPSGSVKDRIAAAMIIKAERAGKITPSKTVLVEPTSGNAGISLALVAAARRYRLIVTMPEGASAERQRMLRLMDAQVELTPAHSGMSGAIERAHALLEKYPNAWMPDQFDNMTNPEVHRLTTGPEIWQDTHGSVDIVVSGIGTGGTATGVAQALKPLKKDLQVIGVEPARSPVLNGGDPGVHGIQGIGAGFCPKTLDLKELDEVACVSDKDAIAAARRCARIDGIPIGISSGAALHVATVVAQRAENKGKTIVVIVPDCAERYLSTALFG